MSDSATPRTAALQASLSSAVSQSLLKLMSIEPMIYRTISSSVTHWIGSCWIPLRLFYFLVCIFILKLGWGQPCFFFFSPETIRYRSEAIRAHTRYPGLSLSSSLIISQSLFRCYAFELHLNPSRTDRRMCAQSCLTLCHSMDCSPPCSSVQGISQARMLEWVSISFSKESSWPSHGTCVSCIGGWILYHWTTCEAQEDR